MKRNIIFFIKDILEQINLIDDSIKGISKIEFIKNKLLVDASIRRLEVIGEAAKNIPEKFRNKYPNVEWKKISGTRDIIIHGYFGIDLDVIWDILKKDIYILKNQIKEILEREKI